MAKGLKKEGAKGTRKGGKKQGKKIDTRRRRESVSLPWTTVAEMEEAWYFARKITPSPIPERGPGLGSGCNVLVTISPRAVNELPRTERTAFWSKMRNKIAEFARYHGFVHVCVWSLESDASSRNRALPVFNGEHMHMLTYIPPTLLDRFEKIGKWSWTKYPDEFHIRSANYRVQRNKRGRPSSARTYLTKNSYEAYRFKNEAWVKGGPIYGKRNGWSTNLGAAARAKYEAQRRTLRAQTVQAAKNGVHPTAQVQDPLF